jgi:hypothetical protein
MKRKRRHPAGGEVGVDELKDAILYMIVERFGDRRLTLETVEMALSLVGFEIKQAVVFAPSGTPAQRRNIVRKSTEGR